MRSLVTFQLENNKILNNTVDQVVMVTNTKLSVSRDVLYPLSINGN